MSKKLFLLDAYALIFRSHYAFIRNPRFNSKGLNTSAIFGFVNTLEDLMKRENPTHLGVAFDLRVPTFRHEMFPEYKANRDATPEDIINAVPYIKDIIRAYHIPILEVERFEADDVIGTLAKKAEQQGFTVYMVTPDKDYGQLVSENIFMYKPRRGDNELEVVGKDEICKYYNITNPMQVKDILALWGDASDNIPGAPGIGEKTAIKLISEYGSIENIFANISKLKGKQRESIEQNRAQVERAKILVTIALDAPIEFNEKKLLLDPPDKSRLKIIFDELDFRSLSQRLLDDVPRQQPVQTQPSTLQQHTQLDLFGSPVRQPEVVTAGKYQTINDVQHCYETITTPEQRAGLTGKLSSLDEFCFDTETTGLDTMGSEIVGMSFSFCEHEAYYVPVPSEKDEAMRVLNEFRFVFENDNIRKTGQNIKFDILMLKSYGIDLRGEIFDTMLAHYLIQPELKHNMNFLAESYLNYSPVPIEALIGKKGKNQTGMRNVPLEKISEYAAEDADVTWQLKKILEPELKNFNLTGLSEKVEMPLVRVLADIEHYGVTVDTEALNKYAAQLTEEIIETEKSIFIHAGMEFNIQSPKQLGEVLFDRLKLSADAKKTKTDQYSTGEDILEKLAGEHPVIDKILEYRSLRKLLSTYIEALPKLVNTKTGKIHTSFNQAVTSTGRLSSNNPNLQNIPVREERGREIRKAFIPSDTEHVFMSADYSQVELRIMAHLSKDPHMLDAFLNNEDIHTATASKIYGIQLSEVTSDMRRKAKTANFGIIYGISAFGLAQRLSISRSEAKQLIDGYFSNYPHVREYMEKSIRDARSKGFVETIMGRRRYLADINSRNAMARGFAERNAINAPIQGSAADIIKLAMVNIHRQFARHNIHSKMIMQVHDELNFDVFRSEVEEVRDIVRTEMQQAVCLDVPLTVDIGVGINWLEAH